MIRLHPVGCAKENPVRIRNDTVTVKGELLLQPLGDREGKAAWNQVRRTALLCDSGIRGLRIGILHNNTELLFMYLYCAENHV